MKCGTELPDDAAFCFKCGAPTAVRGPSSTQDRHTREPEPVQWETLEVMVRAGKAAVGAGIMNSLLGGTAMQYCIFVAQAYGENGPFVAAESQFPMAVSISIEQPDTITLQSAQIALDALDAQLRAQGWENERRGASWYSLRYRRDPRLKDESSWTTCALDRRMFKERGFANYTYQYVAISDDSKREIASSPRYKAGVSNDRAAMGQLLATLKAKGWIAMGAHGALLSSHRFRRPLTREELLERRDSLIDAAALKAIVAREEPTPDNEQAARIARQRAEASGITGAEIADAIEEHLGSRKR